MNVRIQIENETNSGNRRGWHKRVTAVDQSKRNGYALEGEFLNDGEHDVEVGAVIVECYPTGSVKNGGKQGCVYVVQADGSLVRQHDSVDWHSQFPTLRDQVVEALAGEKPNPLAAFSTEELQAEIARRVATERSN